MGLYSGGSPVEVWPNKAVLRGFADRWCHQGLWIRGRTSHDLDFEGCSVLRCPVWLEATVLKGCSVPRCPVWLEATVLPLLRPRGHRL
jgi:hypothetical protein